MRNKALWKRHTSLRDVMKYCRSITEALWGVAEHYMKLWDFTEVLLPFSKWYPIYNLSSVLCPCDHAVHTVAPLAYRALLSGAVA